MYRNLNDDEILYMVSENDNDIFNVLYQKYQPLIYKTSQKYLLIFQKFGYEIDDLMQIGCIALYKAVNYYNVYSNSVFYSYLVKALNNTYVDEIRKNSSLKRETLNNAFSYDLLVPNTNYCYKDLFPSKENSNIEFFNHLFREFKNLLPFDESCVFELYFNGYNVKEISLLLDEHSSSIKRIVGQIKKKALTYKYLFFEKDML